MNKFKLAILGLILFASPSLRGENNSIRLRSTSEATEFNDNLTYAGQAVVLSKLLKKEQITIDQKMVIVLLKEIDNNLSKFFPNGPFTRNDFISIVWLESSFRQFEDGTHGEKGLFQIMPDEFESYHVDPKYFYGVKTNTKMGFRVLKGKYQRWHDYKKSIIAYNGVIRLKNGKWNEKYWKAFQKRKEKIDLVLPLK